MVLDTQLPSRSSHEANSTSPGPYDSGFDADIVIVGAGIVGATLACALRDSGLRVILVEAKPKAAGLGQRRAYAISLMSSRIFQSLGLWDDIRPEITACDRIRLSDGSHPSLVWLRPEDLHRAEDVVYVAEHKAMLRPLYDRLDQTSTLTWHCPAQVESVEYHLDCAFVHLSQKNGQSQEDGQSGSHPVHLKTRLVVAADGAQSPLRQAAQIRTRGWKYWQSCIGFTVSTEKPHHNIAYERFWPSGPFAILPLPGNRAQVVWTAPHEEARRIAALPEAEFLELLTQRYGTQMGRIELETPRIVFPVRLMQSDRYSLHRLALVGDAAHNCHPVGGQGMNMGIRDAAALAQVLARAHAKGQDIGQTNVLRRYDRWRKPENLVILAFTDVLDRFFSTQLLPVVAVRRLGLWMLRRIPLARAIALGLMAGQLGRKPI